MCGIAGYYAPEGIQAGKLAEMSAAMRHRGPDDEGFLCLDADGNASTFSGPDSVDGLGIPRLPDALPSSMVFGLVHRRLSILDLSILGHQPMQDEAGNSILLNGEIYNYRELRETLRSLGHHFVSETDTEVVLAAWRQWNTDCFTRFRGMWAMAIWNAREKELILSRDRFAIKPLYLFREGNSFAFASEAKVLPGLPGIRPEVNSAGLFQYLAYGGLGDPDASLFQDIQEFPPGQWMAWNLRSREIRQGCYYDVDSLLQAEKLTLPREKILEEYARLFTESVQLHLRADVPVGSCLSGGLDSSAIVAEMAGMMGGKPLRTFTAAYHDPGIDESSRAAAVAGHWPSVEAFYTWPDAEGLWQDFRRLIWHQDFPIHSTSMFAQWEVMKLAGQHGMKVLLDGQGADEVLGGYDNFLGAVLLERLQHLQWGRFLKESKQLRQNRLLNVPLSVSRAAFHHLPENLRKAIRRNQRPGVHFLSEAFTRQYAGAPIPELGGKQPDEIRLLSLQRSLRGLLHYEDRNAMAFGIESRVPFMDHPLLEYSMRIPAHFLYSEGHSKYVLRRAVEHKLPAEIVWRKDKKGFITPQHQWQEAQKKQLLSFLHEIPIPGIFHREYILQMAQSKQQWGTSSNEFWKLLSILVWMDVFKVSLE